MARRKRRRGGGAKRRTSRHDKIMHQNLYEGEGASKQNQTKPAKKIDEINRAGKDRGNSLARNRSSISMGGYTGLSRGRTLDRRSQGGRPSFGHQIRGSDSGDPTLMLLNTLLLLVCGLRSEHPRRRTTAVDSRRRVRPSRRRAGGSAARNRRRPR